MLAIVTRRFRVPLLWAVLAHPGNSDTSQCTGLLQPYPSLFERASTYLLLPDRELLGADWSAFRAKGRVPFAIRVRPDLFMARADGSLWSIGTLLRTKRARHTIHTLELFLPDTHLPLKLAAKRLASGEWLLVMTNTPEPRRALQV
ncbi:hypothetical protein MKK63_10795, partial [Methylobacterium sp. J-088]